MPFKDTEAKRRYNREYMRTHPEYGRAASKRYRERHPEKIAELEEERRTSGRRTQATMKWRRANPERVAFHDSRYRAQLAIGSEDTTEYRLILRGDPCSYCGGPQEEIDHIDPLVKGGTETCDNLTSACKSCNSSKRDKFLLFAML